MRMSRVEDAIVMVVFVTVVMVEDKVEDNYGHGGQLLVQELPAVADREILARNGTVAKRSPSCWAMPETRYNLNASRHNKRSSIEQVKGVVCEEPRV